MNAKLMLAAAGLLMASSGVGWAQSSTVGKTSGHMMKNGTVSDTGRGASEHAPGHLKRRGTSASKYTPSHRNNAGSTRESGSGEQPAGKTSPPSPGTEVPQRGRIPGEGCIGDRCPR